MECLYLFPANVKHNSQPDVKIKWPQFYCHYYVVLIWSKIKALKNYWKLHSFWNKKTDQSGRTKSWYKLIVSEFVSFNRQMSVIITKGVEPAVSLNSPWLKGPHGLPRLAQIEWLHCWHSCSPCQQGTEGGLGNYGLSYGWGEGDTEYWPCLQCCSLKVCQEQDCLYHSGADRSIQYTWNLRVLIWNNSKGNSREVQLPRVPCSLGWSTYLGATSILIIHISKKIKRKWK